MHLINATIVCRAITHIHNIIHTISAAMPSPHCQSSHGIGQNTTVYGQQIGQVHQIFSVVLFLLYLSIYVLYKNWRIENPYNIIKCVCVYI